MADDAGAVNGDYTISVQGATKVFGPTVAVDRVTFDIKKGEVVGFLGPNGSGKTTTMRLITSFYSPDGGTIFVDGINTQDDETATRELIGYLPESNPLYEDMLVNEYLAFVADLRGIPTSEYKRNLEQTIDETGINEVYYRPIHELSKGYHQRVGLAQAILHQPEVLILDEPTEGLDPNQRVTIRELIKSLGEERTVLLSTHVMQEVEATCERILLINRGRLVADDTVQELLTRARGLRRLFVEAEGNQIESRLNVLDGVSGIRRLDPIENRKRYELTVAGDADLRPQVFNLAKKEGWTLWELHEEASRLEDVFHVLTEEAEREAR